MKTPFSVHIDAWANGSAIPAKYAFGRPGTDGPFATSDNISPVFAGLMRQRVRVLLRLSVVIRMCHLQAKM